MSLSQFASSQRGWGFHTPRGVIDPGYLLFFIPRLLELYMYGRISDPGMENYRPWVWRDLDVGHRDDSRRALARGASSNQQPARGVGFPTPFGAVSTREISVFVP